MNENLHIVYFCNNYNRYKKVTTFIPKLARNFPRTPSTQILEEDILKEVSQRHFQSLEHMPTFFSSEHFMRQIAKPIATYKNTYWFPDYVFLYKYSSSKSRL